MDPWRKNICPENSNQHYVSLSLFLTEDEKLSMEGVVLLHKQPMKKILETRGDAQNNMIFSRNETIGDDSIIENGKAKLENIHTYGCKTCNKRFLTLQALNDHRHKQSKTMTGSIPYHQYAHNTFNPSRFIDKEGCNLDISLGSSFSIGSSSMPLSSDCDIAVKKEKVYACSVCGNKFISGQALGGHMRRHRTVVQPIIRNSPRSTQPSCHFPFDLNPPAPFEKSDLAEPTINSSQPPSPFTSTHTRSFNFSLDDFVEYGDDTVD
ncbi:hypothetical protein ZOSMA_607G00020 [Zostera marina]|uniref:C2H2-type domain-containing protein n=1 Tax=Zostera marina TaxID=29655 RepID=A0A0K9NVP8_ZOSMR|nr:hypothetical protein ZOSMA_607G00020 [Zostera marina]